VFLQRVLPCGFVKEHLTCDTLGFVLQGLPPAFVLGALLAGTSHCILPIAPSRGVAMCQYAQWVSPLNSQVDLYTRAAAPPHTRLCLPFARLKNLAQLRIGCGHLEVEQGRKRRPAVP
jgi:hypothetical protein